MQTSLRALRYFLAVLEAGSITAAAARLSVSQPSITAALQRLEGELGVTLFVRHHARGVSPTVAGRRLAQEARALLRHADDFAQNAAALGREPSGEIAVACFRTLAPLVMPTLIAEFSRLHPAITIALEEGDQETILASLTSGRSEMALTYHYAMPDFVVVERLAELPPRIFVSAAHPLAGRPSAPLASLAGEPFVLLDMPLSRDYLLGLFAAAGVAPTIAFRSSSYELVRGLVGRNLGYSVLNTEPRTASAYDGSMLASLAIEEQVPPVGIVSLRLARHPVRPAVAAFAAFVRRAFAPGGLVRANAGAR